MRQAARYATTGNKMTGSSRVASIEQVAQNAAVGLVNASNIQISSVNGGSGTNNVNRAGYPQDTVTISMTASLKLFTPLIGRFFGTNGVYTFTVSTTYRNEPFSYSQTS
jgi:hypothetical protein